MIYPKRQDIKLPNWSGFPFLFEDMHSCFG